MIYYTNDKVRVTCSEVYKEPVIDAGFIKYQIVGNEMIEASDLFKGCASDNWISIRGKNYQVNSTGGHRFSNATEDNLYLEDEEGNKLTLPLEIIFLLKSPSPGRRFGNLVVGHIRRYKDILGESLFIGNTETGDFIFREDMGLSNPVLQSDGVYGYYSKNKAFVKLDLELNEIWMFDPGAARLAPMQAIPHEDKIIYYHGFTAPEVLEDVPIPGAEDMVYKHAVRRDGELYCLDRETGEKHWGRMFEYGLNDMVLHDGKLYCVAENELFRLSSETGAIEHQVQLDYSAGGDTELSNVLTVIDNKLWIQINHWFYKTHCLLVVDLDTFAIEHTIDIPEPYQPEIFLYHDESKRQVYYRLHFRHAEIRVEHNHPLLVLSLDELDQPLTFEPRPEIDISFKPAGDNQDLEELWVQIKDTSLHKAIRFGIIETQNQTNIHAEMNRHGESCRKTFNGRVHFRYSGSDKPKEEVEERLQIVEESFNDWAQIMRVEAGTGSGEPVSIDVAYID